MVNEEYLEQRIDWQPYFDEDTLKTAEKIVAARKYKNFTYSPIVAKAQVSDLKGALSHNVSIGGAPSDFGDSWKPAAFKCDCGKGYYYRNKKVSN